MTNNYQAVINLVTAGGFPDKARTTKSHMVGETHTYRSKSKDVQHELLTSEYDETIMGIEVLWSYNYCPTCRTDRNQSVTVFNPESCEVFRHYFLKHGNES